MTVLIDISSEGLLSATLILYGIPLLLLLLGAIIGQLIQGEIGSAFGAGIGLVIGIPIVRFLSNRVARNKRFVAYVKSIIAEQPA
jgi:sigma-E factor negative regulatory protein RseC